MAAQPTPSSADISATAKAEGGPAKGTTSAQMQSEVGKTRNFEQAAQEVGSKMQTNPEQVTSEDAAHLKSREARVIGQGQPPADSISADAQRLASANERGASSASTTESLNSAQQSAIDKQRNFQQAAADVGSKLSSDPRSVTKEDANLLRSRETRAHGATEKGGVVAQAQSLAAENAGEKK